MSSELPIRKVYIDSRYKTPNSNSHSDFTFELKQTIDLPNNVACYIDDIVIPHCWYSIESFNNKLYFQEHDTLVDTYKERILTLTSQNYSGTSLATAISNALSGASLTATYTVTYNTTKGTITTRQMYPT